MHLFFAQVGLLGRHLALAAMADGLLELGVAGAVDERAGVGQVRRADQGGTLAFRAVAGDAVDREDLLAGLDVGLGAFRQLQPGEFGADVGGDV